MITDEQKEKAIRLYHNRSLKLKEISNLTSISVAKLRLIYRDCFESGRLEPRRHSTALKPRVPNGQGKPRYVATGMGRGKYERVNKKMTDSLCEMVAKDYYENRLSCKEVMEKYKIFPKQLQSVRKKYGKLYGVRPRPKKSDKRNVKIKHLISEGNKDENI